MRFTIHFVTFFFLISLLSHLTFGQITYAPPMIFDVKSYGATADGKTDDQKAFERAWRDACEWKGKARFYIPLGTYMLSPIVFLGPCNGSMAFLIKGVLKATTNPSLFLNQDHWITFRYIDGLLVAGGGTLDGQGAASWSYNDCAENRKCASLPATMRFDFIKNGKLKYIRSINSKNVHFNFFACHDIEVRKIRITSPGNSPNTDGIKIGFSHNMRIEDSIIGTGDDCIAILSQSSGILVNNVVCGPGHGISIGSLGSYINNDKVSGISVTNCTLRGTETGLRIKTWADSLPGTASDIRYENIFMDNVRDPIIIDQKYCPHGSCTQKVSSRVQLEGIIYRNIWGTSSSEVAVSFACSETVPCKNIVTDNINLALVGVKQGYQIKSFCKYVSGGSYGLQNPPSCL